MAACPTGCPTAAAYLDYAAVAALIPLALWPLGIYDRLGLMVSRALRHAAAAAAALVVGGLSMAPPAVAITPPVVEPGPPPTGPVAPPQPTELKAICGIPTGVLPATDFTKRTSAEAMLEYRSAWRFSRGAGQKVAVIDTGVNRHPRLRALEPGGDYVSNTDGLQDCDAHGTLVAGIIAAAPVSRRQLRRGGARRDDLVDSAEQRGLRGPRAPAQAEAKTPTPPRPATATPRPWRWRSRGRSTSAPR